MDKNIETIINDSVNKLIEELKQGKSDRLKSYLKFCSSFYNYSVSNTILIHAQMEWATNVAGFKEWNRLGYKVIKGSKSIKILAPSSYTYMIVKGEKVNYKDMTKEQKQQKEKHIKKSCFIPVSVFDKSQVTKIDDSIEVVDSFFCQLGDSHKEQYLNLLKVVESQGIRVEETEDTQGCEGISYGGYIKIKKSLDYNNKLLTLIHEFSHEILDKGENSDRDKTNTAIRECRAEAVSYIVGQYFQIDNIFTRDYLLCYGNTEKEVKAHLEAILKSSNHIIKSLISFNNEKEVA